MLNELKWNEVSKLTISKYHVNTINIDELFLTKSFMAISDLIGNFAILQRETLPDFCSI